MISAPGTTLVLQKTRRNLFRDAGQKLLLYVETWVPAGKPRNWAAAATDSSEKERDGEEGICVCVCGSVWERNS